MAQFKTGDLREEALARVIVDWDTGDALGGEAHPMHVEGDVNIAGTLGDEWAVAYNHGYSDTNDWSIFVPAGQEWQVLWFAVQYGSDAVVGNRQLAIRVVHEAPLYSHLAMAGAVQAASLSYEYLFAPGVADLLAARNTDFVTTPIPVGTLLLAGDEFIVFDRAAISAADSMHTHLQYAWRLV